MIKWTCFRLSRYRRNGQSGPLLGDQVDLFSVDKNRIYRVATIDYLYTHPSYKLSLGQGTDVAYGPLCLDVVIEYVRAHSPVHPKAEGRIRRM